jgi:hypothetical protein
MARRVRKNPVSPVVWVVLGAAVVGGGIYLLTRPAASTPPTPTPTPTPNPTPTPPTNPVTRTVTVVAGPMSVSGVHMGDTVVLQLPPGGAWLDGGNLPPGTVTNGETDPIPWVYDGTSILALYWSGPTVGGQVTTITFS